MMRALLVSSATTDIPALRSARGRAASGGRPEIGDVPAGARSGAGAGVVTGTGSPAPVAGAAVAAGMPGAPGRNVGCPETASGNGPDDTVAVVVREMEATRPCSWLP